MKSWRACSATRGLSEDGLATHSKCLMCGFCMLTSYILSVAGDDVKLMGCHQRTTSGPGRKSNDLRCGHLAEIIIGASVKQYIRLPFLLSP